MRIIAGECRGRRIEGPSDDKTRPTSDPVRESIFNILGDRVVDRTVIDLFAGSGALGLEALSRGAKYATFVDINRENVRLIYRNAKSLGYEDRTKVSLADAHRFGKSLSVDVETPLVFFLDPPYLEYERHADRIGELIESLVQKAPEGSTIVVESGKHWNEKLLPNLEEWDIRRYGGTAVAFRYIDASLPGELTHVETGVDDEIHDDPQS